jgi:UDP-N-acetylmuramoyl-L-alanyl-D-glutamate--2,6-diaminopimelate ligase
MAGMRIMAKLQDILYNVRLQAVTGATNLDVKDIQIDSRKVTEGSVFVAIVGAVSNGHDFITTAIDKGAKVIVCEVMPVTLNEGVTYLQVNNSGEAVAHMAHHYYGEPSTKVKLVGVTGTNGKTTIATLLFKVFTKLGYKCGLISTVQNQIGNTVIPATHTTPDAISLQALLKEMADANVLMYLWK